MTESPTAFRLKELTALKAAIESEISMTLLYLSNEGRWKHDLEREEKKLARQAELVARLRDRYENGHEHIARWQARRAEITQDLALLRNEHLIDKLYRLQQQASELGADAQSVVNDEALSIEPQSAVVETQDA